MKIVCDACQAKYSISDDKVQGKVFKIRCKKCSNIIVVRGGAGAVEQAAAPAQEKETRVYDYGYEGQGPGADDAVWHVVINQDQVGPMTAAEVEKRYAAGEIDADTYAWREGFADWMPLSQVDAFAAFAAGNADTAISSGGGGGAAAASIFGSEGLGSAGSDLFGSGSASSSAMAASGDDDGGDLFGSNRSARTTGAPGGAGAAAEAKLRGERNENSVLFSLNNLAQLASDKPAPSAAVTSMPSGQATGAAGGEGSGLIDIRSMANAYLGGSAASAPRTAAAVGTIDDLPVFGGGGFTEPAVLVPTAGRSSNNKMMFALIGSVGVLAVAAVIMVVVLLKGGKTPTKVATAPAIASNDKDDTKSDTPSTPDSPGSSGSAAEPTKAGSADTAAAADKASDPEPKTPPPPSDTNDKPDRHSRDKTAARDRPRETSTRTTAKADPPPAKEPAAASGGCDEVSCVLNNYEGACCSKFRKGGSKGGTASASKGRSDLPDKLDRGMIQGAVEKVKARVMSCGDRSSAKGMVKVSVKVSPDGRVSSSSPTQSPDASLGNCVASAMSKASFPKTQSGGSFSYPFNF
ncbi:MAG: GYF domain-containing protein [Kofleriaceae bacterium]